MSGIEGLLAGRTLVKRYKIEEVIGRGGFAAVYRADDLRLGRPVAVKVITVPAPDPAMAEQLHARFEREARAAASLPHHPNVVTVHDFGTDPETGIDFLVMELLEGENLAQRLSREGKPPVDVALDVLREAAEGLAAGHRAGLVHRDVKPGNIFLAEPHDQDPFRVCVLDFGIARIADPEHTDATLTRAHGNAPLSPAYASPEQLRGERELALASDVFSLGVVGYQLLTGVKPFEANSPHDRAEIESLAPAHQANPDVPEAVSRVIRKAMAYDPAGRYPDAGAFAQALDAAVAEDDRTVLAPAGAAAVAADDDRTVLQPPPAVVAAPAPRPRPEAAAPPPPPPSMAAPARPAARKRGFPLWLVVLPLLALGAWMAYGAMADDGGGDDPAPAGGAPPVVATDDPGEAPDPGEVPAFDGGGSNPNDGGDDGGTDPSGAPADPSATPPAGGTTTTGGTTVPGGTPGTGTPVTTPPSGGVPVTQPPAGTPTTPVQQPPAAQPQRPPVQQPQQPPAAQPQRPPAQQQPPAQQPPAQRPPAQQPQRPPAQQPPAVRPPPPSPPPAQPEQPREEPRLLGRPVTPPRDTIVIPARPPTVPLR
jgi:eukaryotic-like serine/threonine-protein kinase